jgi:hypothetical protein
LLFGSFYTLCGLAPELLNLVFVIGFHGLFFSNNCASLVRRFSPKSRGPGPPSGSDLQRGPE